MAQTFKTSIVVDGNVNATGFYGDGSNLTGITPTGALLLTGGDMTGSLTITAGGIPLTLTSSQNTGLVVDGGTNSGVIADFKFGTRKAYISTSGNIYVSGLFDIDDTNYYVNPAGTSNFSTVNAVNTYVGNAIYFGGANNYLNWDGSRINSNVGIQSGVDMRAPIFYDSIDPNYYVDPSGTSNLNELNVGGQAVITAGNIGSQSVSYAATAGTATDALRMYRSDNRTISPSELGAGRMEFGFTSWNNNGGDPYADFLHFRSYTDSSGGADNLLMFRKDGSPAMRLWTQSWGSASAYSSYVDVITSGNIGSQSVNYANSAGSATDSSKLPLAGGTLTGALSINADDGVKATYNVNGGDTWLRGWGIESNRSAVYLRPLNNNTQTLFIGYSEGSQNWNGVSVDASSFDFNGNAIIHAGNIGSQSVNYATSAGSANSVAWGNISSIPSLWYQSGSWLGDLGSNGFTRESGLSMTGGSEFVVLSKSGQGYTLVDGGYFAYEASSGGSSGGFWSSYNSSYGTASGFRATDTDLVTFIQADGGSIGVEASGNMRAPIFYDSNDTSYYVNPNSTSLISELYLTGAINYNGSVANDSGYGLYFGSSRDSAYGIFREPGAWSSPFPDLRIAFHTGIKLGANAGYNGIRFYDDYTMATQVMSVNNGSDGYGAGHVYVNNIMHAGGSHRAPIFYDSNDTNYYIDANGNSRIFRLNLSENQPNATNNAGGRVRISSFTNGASEMNNDSYNIVLGPYSTRAGTGYYAGIAINGLMNYGGVTTYDTAPHVWIGAQYRDTPGSERSDFVIGVKSGTGVSGTGADIPQERFRVDYNGIATATGSFRAPIFYDSNDTGYYVDPNSVSRVSELRVNELSFIDGSGVWSNIIRSAAYPSEGFSTGSNYWLEYRAKGGHHFVLNTDGGVGGGANSMDDFTIWQGAIDGNRLFEVTNTGNVTATADMRAPIFYDSNDTGYYANLASATSLYINGGVNQNNLVGRPHAVWGSTSTTGAVVIKFPGGTGNYGMIHAVIDIYEYSGDYGCTVIVSGHNWNGAWYNYGAQLIGRTNKPVRVGVKDGQYCIVIGNGSTSWSYGQVVLRKIQNGTYYQNVMNVGEGYTVNIESDSYSWISGDLRQLNITGNIISSVDMRAPIFYDSDNTTFYANPGSTSRFRDLWVRGDNQYEGYVMIGGDSAGARLNINFDQMWTNVGNLHLQYSSSGNIDMNQGGGYTFSRTSLRAPIFYDYNDTSYYVDPNSTTRLNSMYIVGGVAGISNSSSYTEAAIEVREREFGGAQDDTWATAPRIGFHWSGRVASQIAMSSAGWINIMNNPGNGFESFRAGAIYSTGDVTAYYSDIRLKDIQGPITNALNAVLSIDTFKYKHNEIAKENGFEGDDIQLGVSAQSVEAVFPELVKHAPFDIEHQDGIETSKTGEWYKTVKYERLVPVLIEAIKEQQKQIEELKAIVNGITK